MTVKPSQQAGHRRIIADLIHASHTCALAAHQDGGVKVDIVWSERRGHRNDVMTLEEAESRLDAAINRAYFALSGRNIPNGIDPHEFVTNRR